MEFTSDGQWRRNPRDRIALFVFVAWIGDAQGWRKEREVPMYDVIIIGGGPAGTAAAYRLSRDGLKTLILEKNKFPRYKPCGGGLTKRALDALDYDVTPLVEERITRVLLSRRHRMVAEVRSSKSMVWGVMRDEFDNHMMLQATGAGAILHAQEQVRRITVEPARIIARTDKGEYAAAMAIGADGANSVAARAVGLNPCRYAALTYAAEVRVSTEQMALWRGTMKYDFGTVPFGYAWVFAKKDHLSVGIGTHWSGRNVAVGLGKLLRGPNCDLRARLHGWIEAESSLRNHSIVLERGHFIPLRVRGAHRSCGHLLLVGDAAGLANPLTGEGIYYQYCLDKEYNGLCKRFGWLRPLAVLLAFQKELRHLAFDHPRIAAVVTSRQLLASDVL